MSDALASGTIAITLDGLKVKLKPEFSSNSLVGAKVSVATAVSTSIAGETLPANTELLKGAVKIEGTDAVKLLITRLLGMHVREHLDLTGATATTIIGDLESAFAAGGNPAALVSDLLMSAEAGQQSWGWLDG